jgi:hypothetical protein
VLTEDGARSFVNGNWTEVDVLGFIGTKKMDVETPPVGGMGHIDFIGTVHEGELYYTVVYEVREGSSSNSLQGAPQATPKHIVIQSYLADGTFLFQKRVENARSPKVVVSADPSSRANGWVMVFYQVTGTGEIKGKAFHPLNALLGGELDSGIFPSKFFALESIGNSEEGVQMRYTRLGASADGIGRYHVVTQMLPTDQYVFLTQEAGSVKAYLRNAGLAGGGPQTLVGGLGPGPNTWQGEALDVAVQGSVILFLYTVFDTNAPTGQMSSEIYFERWTSTLGVRRWGLDPVHVGASRTYTHGGIAAGGAEAAWMVHDSGETGYQANKVDPVDWEKVRDPDTGILYEIVSMGTGIGNGVQNLWHHRLASRPVFFENKLYCAVQQWADYTPLSRDLKANPDFQSILGAQKPKTTVLACLDYDSNSIQPVAYVDAGQSKTSEYGESELMVHTPHIQIENGDLVFANRLVIRVEDMSMFFSSRDPGRRQGALESPADAQCRIHRVTKGSSATIQSTPLGDGLITSTAIPLWYDGKFFGELGPLDAPEIIRVRDIRTSDAELDDVLPQGFEPTDEGDADNWRQIQIVLGYYDAKGNKHRSAPSTTLWVQYLSEDDADSDPNEAVTSWVGKSVEAAFTWPLSMLPADLEYFVEVYASDGISDDPRLIDVDTIPLGVSPSINHKRWSTGGDVIVEFQLIRDALIQGTTEFKNPPRTSRAVYTSGGTLTSDPWPSFNQSVSTSTRLWVLDAANKGRVIPSKLFEDFISPEYNSTLTIRLGDERNLTAIGKLDDKVVVFEPNNIHVIYGEGPDNRGQGQDFAVHYVTTDVGCEDQESVIETPAGLIFYSKPRGFYLLDRNLQIQFIGGGVEDLAREIDVVTATLVPDKAEVRFVFNGGPHFFTRKGPSADTTDVDRPPKPVFTNTVPLTEDAALSYNYERGTWMVFTNYTARAATIYQNKYTMLLSNWDVWQESETRFDDPTGLNLSVMVTPWIKLSEQIQSFERLWRMTFLGRYMSSLQDIGEPPFPLGSGPAYEAGDVQVTIYYDYESSPSQTKTFYFQDFGYNPFNNPPNRAERFQFEMSPTDGRGRCQAVKIHIAEKLSSDRGEGLTYKQGHGFEIVSIDFDVGVSPMRSLLPQKSKK